MGDATDRLRLPLIAAGQAQKEVTHNETLLLLDALVQASIQATGLTAPPATPQLGQCWLVGRGATGAWQGQDDALAAWTSGGWRFVPAFDGLALWLIPQRRVMRYTSGQWTDALEASALRIAGRQVVGPQQPAIAAPSGGVTPDVQARQTISAILSALSAHGLIAN